jgi:hypothetical protein
MGASQNKVKAGSCKVVNGLPQGSGTFTQQNGEQLQGTFVNGKLEGPGS